MNVCLSCEAVVGFLLIYVVVDKLSPKLFFVQGDYEKESCEPNYLPKLSVLQLTNIYGQWQLIILVMSALHDACSKKAKYCWLFMLFWEGYFSMTRAFRHPLAESVSWRHVSIISKFSWNYLLWPSGLHIATWGLMHSFLILVSVFCGGADCS